MISHARRKRIVELIGERRQMTVQELERVLKSSSATIRRDLTELQHQGQVVRVHGGVLHPNYLSGEPTWDARARKATDAKRAIAEAALGFVGPKQTVFIDSGTTCLEVARRLLTREDLTLVTTSVPVLETARNAEARVIALGGEYRRTTKALVGAIALTWLEHMRFDVAFIGAAGLSAEDGVSTTELREAEVKQYAIKRSEQAILVSDTEKWRRPAAIRFAEWDDFDAWATNDAIDAADARRIERCGTRIVVAGGAPRKAAARPTRKRRT